MPPAPPAAPRHALLLAAVFLGVGVSLPFLPPFLAGRGLGAEAVGWALAAASLTRFLAGPPLGRLADRLGDARPVLGAAGAFGAVAALLFLPAEGFAWILAVQVLLALATAPMGPLAEALTLSALGGAGGAYGRARAAGSAAFVLGALSAGWLAASFGTEAVPWLLALSHAGVALSALALPRPGARTAALARGAMARPPGLPGFARLILLSALIQGSHAAYYGFASLHWAASGLPAGTVGLLWSVGVVAEIALFWWAGPLLGRLSPRSLTLIAAGAGVLRWLGTAATAEPWALLPLQALHALTFGAQHLAAMRWIAGRVPAGRAASAQSWHTALGHVAALAAGMLAAGWLYGRVGGGAFLAMAGLCALALPVAALWRQGAGLSATPTRPSGG